MREAECKSVCVHKKISLIDGPIWVSLALCSKAKLIIGTVILRQTKSLKPSIDQR